MADELKVLLNDMQVGVLRRSGRGARFAYLEEIVDRYGGSPVLSASLPVKSKPYREGLTESWFSGLLPEGARLDKLCREIGCKTSDYYTILAEVGWECAGAVCITGSTDGSGKPGQDDTPQRMSEEELAAYINSLPGYVLENGQIARLSLGGYQDKACLVVREIEVSNGYAKSIEAAIPGMETISTHIAKPQPRNRYENMALAEAWAMAAAASATRCAEACLMEFPGMTETVLIKRFDRKNAGNRIERVHQEDFCQALGIPPEGKYASVRAEKDTDPSYEKFAGVLKRHSENPYEEMLELLRQMTVNIALGNNDAHAKNYSVLYDKGFSLKLAPLYDVVPVDCLEPESKYLSLRVNGKIEPNEITMDDLTSEAEKWGLEKGESEQMLLRTLDAISKGVSRADSMYGDRAQEYSAKTMQRIERLSVRQKSEAI